jgi:phosphotransacetylase
MDPIKDKINQILEETKKLVSDRNFEKAIKNLETILVIDPSHEEASYVLSKIKDKKVTSEVIEPNVFIEDNLWGAMVVTKYYVDGVEVARIADKGSTKITIPNWET